MTIRPPAVLVLEDGRTFHGESYGAVGETFGEAVFATAMTGYQETLTDPSFHRQVVCQTAPHIGNTGWNDDDDESDRIWVAGYVVRDPSRTVSSWRATRSLDDELGRQGIVGISGIDTRALTRHLRDRGAMRCAITSIDAPGIGTGTGGGSGTDALLARVLASPQMVGADLVAEVTTPQPYTVAPVGSKQFRVVAVDLGIKRNTPASLARQGVETVVVPAGYTAEQVLALSPDGVFFSNGPGDPDVVDGPRDLLAALLGRVPVFGICMGNQMLGRALGLDTYKLPFGHRGANQPVQDLTTRRVAVTSHNHGFAVAAPGSTAPVPAGADPATPFDTPYGRAVVSHVDLNDGVVEGLRCLDVPAFSVQYHPEAAPGPHDALGLFERFAELMRTGVSA